jgi:hypothetical protein
MASIARAEQGLLRGVRKKVPKPFLPLQGRLKTPSFQLEEPYRNLPKPAANCLNLPADSGRLPKPKAPARVRARAAKLRRRRAIALDFKVFF